MEKIIIGPYEISKHEPILSADQKNVLWILLETGEGMSVDLDALWKEKF